MGISWIQILVVAVLLILLFGRGRISSLMGDVASGITSFRRGLREGGAAEKVGDATNEAIDATTGTTIEGETSEVKTDQK